MRNQTQQKPIIKRLNTVWRAVGIAWVVWGVIGQVSDIFFLNPAYYWIHEMIFRRWSDVFYILLAVTVVVSILASGLMLLYRKREIPETEKIHQELSKMKEGETMLDYFHRIQSIKKDEALSEWFKETKSQGYSVPVAMCHGIQIAMKELNKSFVEVFELFVKRAIIIQAGKTFIYDLRGHKALIPKGLHKCEKCGEYKGSVMEKDLNWDDSFHREESETSEEYLTVSCLCDGILCHKCKKNRVHRPISNYYDEGSNSIWHVPHFTGQFGCAECREKKNNQLPQIPQNNDNEK